MDGELVVEEGMIDEVPDSLLPAEPFSFTLEFGLTLFSASNRAFYGGFCAL